MGLFDKLADRRYLTQGPWEVAVRRGRAAVMTVTNPPDEAYGSSPVRDSQEVFVSVAHTGDGAYIQVVRRNKLDPPEALAEFFVTLGSHGAPEMQNLIYRPEMVPKIEPLDAVAISNREINAWLGYRR